MTSPLDYASINDFLAREVMGWRLEDYKTYSGFTYPYYFKGATPFQRADDWNPTESIEQAMMCLERFEEWMLESEPELDSFQCWIRTGKAASVNAYENSIALAISFACARAKGWEE